MKLVLIAEGRTERAFVPHLRRFLEARLAGSMPRLSTHIYDGRIPTGDKLKRVVARLLSEQADAVIALTDVYTGKLDFEDGQDARKKMRDWVGPELRFYPHAAQHDFEAWLLPYWSDIQHLSGSNKTRPAANPETVNHNNPPARRINEVFRTGTARRAYVKARDVNRILMRKDLGIAAAQCSELRLLLNTMLMLCGSALIP